MASWMALLLLLLLAAVTYNQVQPLRIDYIPDQLVYTQITTRQPNCFKFIIALIMPAETSYKQTSNCLILYMLHHKACSAGAESTMSGAYTHIYSACMPQVHNSLVYHTWNF